MRSRTPRGPRHRWGRSGPDAHSLPRNGPPLVQPVPQCPAPRPVVGKPAFVSVGKRVGRILAHIEPGDYRRHRPFSCTCDDAGLAPRHPFRTQGTDGGSTRLTTAHDRSENSPTRRGGMRNTFRLPFPRRHPAREWVSGYRGWLARVFHVIHRNHSPNRHRQPLALIGHHARPLLQFQDRRIRALPAKGQLSIEHTHRKRGGDPTRLSGAASRSSAARAMERGRSAALSTPSLAFRRLSWRGQDLARARARSPAQPRQHEDPSPPR